MEELVNEVELRYSGRSIFQKMGLESRNKATLLKKKVFTFHHDISIVTVKPNLSRIMVKMVKWYQE